MKLEYTISQDAAGQRLDKFLRKRLMEMPLSHLYKLVRTKKVRVNGARADIAQLLQPGDVVVVHGAREANPQAPGPREARPASAVPQDFAVLYEDAHILVCDKPGGLAIHAGSGIAGDTLVDEVRAYLHAHPEMKKATYKIPHDNQAAGTAAKTVLHVAAKMGRRTK